MDFTNNLSDLRKEKRLNQKDLAVIINVSQSTICHWEKGDQEPSIDCLNKLADFFGVSVDYLLGREDDFGNIVIKNNASFAVSEAEKKHLTNLRRLKPQTQQYIFGLVENLALSV